MTEILYIEDNEFDRLSFKDAMSVFSTMRIDYAVTIEQAKKFITSHKYNIIVSDFNLPDGNAYDILDLKTESPVIVLTGQGDEATAVKSIQKGAKDYIFKDFNSKHLKILPVVIEKTLRLDEAEKAQARLAAIVESAGDAILTVGLDDKIMTWNKGAEKIYGYTNYEAIGSSCSILCNGNCDPMKRMVDTVKSTHETCLDQTIHKRKNGEKIHVGVSLSPVWDSTGNINCFSMIARDITEIRLKQKQLQEKEQELKRSKEIESKKDEFIGIASHELKTPLTSLKAYIQLLEKQAKTFAEEDRERFISSIVKTANYIHKLETLINDLFSISKIRAGKLTYNIDEFPFDDLVEETADSLRRVSQEHTIKVNGKTNVIIQGDKLRLEEVLTNYLTNAIKFSPEFSEITISVSKTDDEITVCVTDQGVGINTEDLPHIFKRYYRSEENSYKFPGLGIGLFISKEIITRHNGHVWVESEKNKGSRFYFRIPIKQPDGCTQRQ